MENYSKIGKVGEGTYGKVYKGKDNRDGKIYALKRIQMDREGVPSTAIREILILKSLHHKNVISLCEVLTTDHSIYLVFDFMQYDLKSYMDMYEGGLPPTLVKNFMEQLLCGLAYCHGNHIMHRDIKPQNILIDLDGCAKLADFGLSRNCSPYQQVLTHEIITLWYRCPEVLLGAVRYTFAVDMWSLACVFAEMSNKKPLFPGDSEIDQLFKIFRTLGTPSKEQWNSVSTLRNYKTVFPKWQGTPLAPTLPSLSSTACELLQRMLTYNPEERITARQALNHHYFTGVKNNMNNNKVNNKNNQNKVNNENNMGQLSLENIKEISDIIEGNEKSKNTKYQFEDYKLINKKNYSNINGINNNNNILKKRALEDISNTDCSFLKRMM